MAELRRRGRPRKQPAAPAVAPDEIEFGFDPPEQEAPPSAKRKPSPPAPEIVALGAPPADAAGMQKWSYALLSTMAYLAAIDPGLSNDERELKVRHLTAAAARHYPEAARFDLSQKIERDAAELVGKKRAKAAAKLETRDPAGAAKILPFRSEG